MELKIHLLGKPAIFGPDGEPRAVRGLQSWGLLARILLSRRPLARRDLALELFPEAIDPLGALRWCLAALRRALGSATALNGDPVASNLPAGIWIDVDHLETGEIDLQGIGDLLDGIEPRCSPEFATWLLIERARTASRIDARIRMETMQALSLEEFDSAIRLAALGVKRAPLDEGAHVRLVKSLATGGCLEAALVHVAATEALFAAELGQAPSPALRAAAQTVIPAPVAGIPPLAVVRTQLDVALAALASGAADVGLDGLRRAAASAERYRDVPLQARALLELGTALVHAVRGRDDEGAILLRQSIELARLCGNPAIAAAGFRELGYVDALVGRRPSAAQHLASALALTADADSLAGIHAVIGFNLVDWGRPAEGIGHYEISLEHARRAGNKRREGWSLGLGGWGQLSAGNAEQAERWLRTCLDLVGDLNWMAFRPWPIAVLAETRLLRGDDPGAVRHDLEDAFALSCQLGDPCWEAAVARALALTHVAEDDPVRAMQWLGEGKARAKRDGSDAYAALVVAILADQADVSIQTGQMELADGFLRELLARAARAHMDAHLQRAAVLLGRQTPARILKRT